MTYSEEHTYVVDVWEIDAGTWIVKSSEVELLRSRKKLEALIGQIDERLEKHSTIDEERV